MHAHSGHSSICDTFYYCAAKKSRDSCQLDAENQVYCQPYRNISRLVLLRVLSTIEVGLKFTIVDVPSAFVLTHISSDRADVTWIRAS